MTMRKGVIIPTALCLSVILMLCVLISCDKNQKERDTDKEAVSEMTPEAPASAENEVSGSEGITDTVGGNDGIELPIIWE